MEKKNTILLTVIAIATLLVAVVGATFAYFSVTVSNNTGVTVDAKTAVANDVFTATGAGDVKLTVNNTNMMDDYGNNDYSQYVSDTDNSLTVKLEAGSGKATCHYDLQLVQDASGVNTYDPTSGITKEFTIQGTNTNSEKFDEIQINTALANSTTSNAATEKNGTDGSVQGTTQTTGILGSYVIEDTYEENSQATEYTWTITAKFYNLAVPQDSQINQTFGYTVRVVNVNCTNAN